MLQQTQAERVVPYYEAFVTAFPSPAECARSRPAAVVRLWAGLGYNRRALNLHRAATVIARQHDGLVPDNERSLLALPGIGPSTVRAVLSFAFGADVSSVDTNVVRVLARCVHGSGMSLRQAQSLADRLLPTGSSWEFNQTMFDLGATVCTAARPACDQCPLRRQCRWWRAGLPGPDPWRASPSVRTQSRFDGSDRQGRGRLLNMLRQGPVGAGAVAIACGWPEDPQRADRIAGSLVTEGFAEWTAGRRPALRLR